MLLTEHDLEFLKVKKKIKTKTQDKRPTGRNVGDGISG